MNRLQSLLLAFLAALAFTASPALGHGGVDLGPQGGRLVTFGQDSKIFGEVVLRDGRFVVTLLDAEKKPVVLKDQVLTVIGGDRANPTRPEVERHEGTFRFPALKGERYPLVLQLRPEAEARPLTARFEFDASICSGCKAPEWLCRCEEE